MVSGVTIKIGQHIFLFQLGYIWPKIRYFIGMKWHEKFHPNVNYEGKSVAVEGLGIPVSNMYMGNFEFMSTCTVGNLEVKKFRSMLKKRGNREDLKDFQVHIRPNPPKETEGLQSKNHSEESRTLNTILDEYSEVFTDDFPMVCHPRGM